MLGGIRKAPPVPRQSHVRALVIRYSESLQSISMFVHSMQQRVYFLLTKGSIWLFQV